MSHMFDDAGREITQAFNVLGSNLTLAAGLLGALLAVIGAGELFGGQTVIVNTERTRVHTGLPSHATVAGLPKLSAVSLLVLALALPLLLRFFVRATIGYQQLQRYNLVSRACWQYLAGDRSWVSAKAHVDVYVVRWRSPATARSLIIGSAKYGFVWIAAIYLVVLGWALATVPDAVPREVAAVILVAALLFDPITLGRSSYFKEPDATERALLPDDGSRDDEEGSNEHDLLNLLNRETGIFIGRRWTAKRPQH